MAFNPLDHPLAFLQPDYLSNGSAWVGHIPFASTLIGMCRPRLTVELGTSRGDSYCAFCQAIAASQIHGARAFAIDKWKEDPRERTADEDVLTPLRAHHDPRYSHFSTLIQSDFDSARSQFVDGSIDLLHIDGCHTYDAVKHDYLTWLPKLSPAGVVLFHDTVERGPDFGVWRLWQEISPSFPHFQFEHSHGLGILAIGPQAPDPLLHVLADATADPEPIRHFFTHLAHQIELLRTFRTLVYNTQIQQMLINECRRQLGQPPRQDPALAHQRLLDFSADLAEDLRALIIDHLNLRQQSRSSLQ